MIRGIRNLKTNTYITGVTKIVTEIFAALGNILLKRNAIYLDELESDEINFEEPVKTIRKGLTRKENDNENFIDKPYR